MVFNSKPCSNVGKIISSFKTQRYDGESLYAEKFVEPYNCIQNTAWMNEVHF